MAVSIPFRTGLGQNRTLWRCVCGNYVSIPFRTGLGQNVYVNNPTEWVNKSQSLLEQGQVRTHNVANLQRCQQSQSLLEQGQVRTTILLRSKIKLASQSLLEQGQVRTIQSVRKSAIPEGLNPFQNRARLELQSVFSPRWLSRSLNPFQNRARLEPEQRKKRLHQNMSQSLLEQGQVRTAYQ